MRTPIIVLLLLPFMIFAGSFEQELEKHVRYHPGENAIGLINIDDKTQGISESTWLYVKKALEYYKDKHPSLIILNLNTPGGEVFAAQKISDALKEFDTQEEIPILAFVNNWAISAGAMLAYSSRFIVVTKDGSMGAAEPILMGESGESKPASEKINSALRTDFANRARFFDRNPDIAEAMVDKDIILVRREGKILKLDAETQIKPTDQVISSKGKLLTLNAEQLVEDHVADAMVNPMKLSPITEAEREAGRWPLSKSGLIQIPYLSKIPNAFIDLYQMDWKTRFFVFLASPVVSSMLVLGLMIGFYLEISHPGFGLPGTIALLCLFLIALSTLSLEIANWLELILLITGLLILLLELFVLPTFGLLGFIGLLFFIAGLFGMLIPNIGSIDFDFDTHSWNAAGTAIIERVAWLCGTLLLGVLIIFLLGRFFTPRIAVWSRLVLSGGEQEGYVAGQPMRSLPQPGSRGVAFTTLRPAGKVQIEEVIYDAITDGQFIDKGSEVHVIRVEGGVIVVACY